MAPAALAEHSQEAPQTAWLRPESTRSSALAQCFLCRAGAVLSCTSPGAVASILSEVNHQLESRMRENRQSGSEGRRSESNRLSLPLYFHSSASRTRLLRPTVPRCIY